MGSPRANAPSGPGPAPCAVPRVREGRRGEGSGLLTRPPACRHAPRTSPHADGGTWKEGGERPWPPFLTGGLRWGRASSTALRGRRHQTGESVQRTRRSRGRSAKRGVGGGVSPPSSTAFLREGERSVNRRVTDEVRAPRKGALAVCREGETGSSPPERQEAKPSLGGEAKRHRQQVAGMENSHPPGVPPLSGRGRG